MNDFRCFIWDFDGTLYDTYDRIVRAVKKGMADMGLTAEGLDLKALAKSTLRGACETIAGDRADELLSRYFMYAEDEGPESMQPYEGCEEALKAIVDNGGFNYLYTHRNETALAALRRDGLEQYFRDFITDEADFPSKPAPDALNWLIGQHHLDRSECVMIGDRIIDVMAGKNAGIKSALFDPERFYKEEDADFFFTRLADIPPVLMEEALSNEPADE